MLQSVEKVKGGPRNNRDYGRLYTIDMPFKAKLKIYLAKRTINRKPTKSGQNWRSSDVWLAKRPDFSSAINQGVACWAIDYDTLLQMRRQGVDLVGVCDESTGWVWVAQIWKWFDPAFYSMEDFSSRGGSHQRFMNFRHFKAITGCKNMTVKARNAAARKLIAKPLKKKP